jgi:CHASE2 domain-containing sensor protein
MLVFSRRKRFVVGLIVATSIGAVLCVAFGFDLFYSMQLQSSDFLFKATNPVFSKEPDDRVIVIGIDDKSLSELGKFSLWPRSHYAQMIDILNEANARVIVFDVLFSEPAPGDDELAGSIKNAGNVVLPLAYVPNISNSILIDKVGGVGNFIHPLSVFEEGAAALGHANIIPDEDGVVRRLQVIISDDDYQPALALAVVAKYLRRPEVLQSPVEDDALPFAGRLSCNLANSILCGCPARQD